MDKDKTIDALKARVSRLQEAARLGERREAGRAVGVGTACATDDLEALCRRSAELLRQVSGAVAEGEERALRPGRRSLPARPICRRPLPAEPDTPRMLSWAAVRDAVAQKDAAQRVSKPGGSLPIQRVNLA